MIINPSTGHTQITDQLYVGGIAAFYTLSKRGIPIDVWFHCALEESPDWSAFEEVIWVRLDDGTLPPEQEEKVERASELAAQRIRDGKRVLISCFAGLNRSGIVAARTLQRLGHENVIELLREKRSTEMLCNEHFARYVDYCSRPKYAGIGSRTAPTAALELAERYGKRLRELGYVLRSGGAQGMDSAFESGAEGRDEIFGPDDCLPWCLDMVKRFIPEDRPPLERMKPYVQRLIARDMQQILGRRGDVPVKFVVCWTPSGKDDGGTGYAIRCAWAHDIPVYNLRNDEDHRRFREEVLGE